MVSRGRFHADKADLTPVTLTDQHADTGVLQFGIPKPGRTNPSMGRVSLQYRPPSWKRDDMAEQNPKVLHLLCTSLLAIAFLAVGVGCGALANDSGEDGANIGAGILMLFGYAVGVPGLVLGAAALIADGVMRRRDDYTDNERFRILIRDAELFAWSARYPHTDKYPHQSPSGTDANTCEHDPEWNPQRVIDELNFRLIIHAEDHAISLEPAGEFCRTSRKITESRRQLATSGGGVDRDFAQITTHLMDDPELSP